MAIKSIKWWKYSGIYLLITGILHCAISVALFGQTYIQILNDGFIRLIQKDVDKGLALWFLICGFFLLLFGKTLHYYIKKEQKPAPVFFRILYVIVCYYRLSYTSCFGLLAFYTTGCYHNWSE